MTLSIKAVLKPAAIKSDGRPQAAPTAHRGLGDFVGIATSKTATPQQLVTPS